MLLLVKNNDGISCSGTLDNVSIYNNIGYGIYATNDLDVSNSNILRNSNYKADSNNLDYNLILTNNYWNDQSGPYHPIHNSSGLFRDTTTFYIDEITPWLTEPDVNAPPIPPHNLSLLQTSNNSISVQWDESLF